MTSPFPGMDPYLEDPEIWPGFHHRLANELADRLTPLVGPKYYADVETRTVAEDVAILLPPHVIRPDVGVYASAEPENRPEMRPQTAVAVPEAPVRRVIILPDQTKVHSVRVYVTETGQLVTAIEILSPFNKQHSRGLEEYRQKRRELLRSPVHLVEIDLLRGGDRPGQEVVEPPLNGDYVLLVNRAVEGNSRLSEIWTADLNQPLPALPVPLLAPDPDVLLDPGAAVKAVYTRAGYEWRIHYDRPMPPPAPRPEIAAWLREHLPRVGQAA